MAELFCNFSLAWSDPPAGKYNFTAQVITKLQFPKVGGGEIALRGVGGRGVGGGVAGGGDLEGRLGNKC